MSAWDRYFRVSPYASLERENRGLRRVIAGILLSLPGSVVISGRTFLEGDRYMIVEEPLLDRDAVRISLREIK